MKQNPYKKVDLKLSRNRFINSCIRLLILFLPIVNYVKAQDVKYFYIKDTLNVYPAFEIDVFGYPSDTTYYVKFAPKTDGHWYIYSTDFKHPDYESICLGDTCIDFKYYKNGNIARKLITAYTYGTFYFGQWCENGTLRNEITFYNKPYLPFKTYYCNGLPEIESYYSFGIFVGKCKKWYSNGQLMIDGQFDEHGARTGIWRYYLESGELEREDEYVLDELKAH